MSSITTKKFSNHVADQLIESITEPANNTYYVTASRHIPYTTGDDSVPTPNESFDTTDLGFYRELIFGKKVQDTDIIKVISRNDWTSGSIYDRYDNTSTSLLSNKNFYVGAVNGGTYYVYKVLDNNNGAASTVKPTSTSESACNFITTGDGYRWKLMYSIPTATFNKFATSSYVPVLTSSNVVSNNITNNAKGAVDTITVSYRGSNYVATLAGRFNSDDLRTSIPTLTGNNTTYRLTANASSNTDFYIGSAMYIEAGTGQGQLRTIVAYNPTLRVVSINTPFDISPATDSDYIVAPNVVVVGDGSSNVSAYAVIQSNSSVTGYVEKIEVIDRGTGFTHASVSLVGNTGGVSNAAVLNIALPPGDGHGSDPATELGCTSAMISLSFSNNESGFITTDNDYRTVSLVKDVLFSNVTFTLGSERGNFTTGENIHQLNYVTLTGTVTSNSADTTITGTDTLFLSSLVSGDKVIITDSTGVSQFLGTVNSISNNTSLDLNSNAYFDTVNGTVAKATITATGIKVGNSSPYITLSNVEPKFVTGKVVIGETSGAWANVTAINVQEKSYNSWNTFDNRTRISYTSNNGAFTEDDVIYQNDVSLSNGYFHSANNTFIFFTEEKGPINADPSSPISKTGASVSYIPGSIKYVPDIVKGSGEVIYIENNSPISRSNSQTETIKLVLNF